MRVTDTFDRIAALSKLCGHERPLMLVGREFRRFL
jgi:hypothetical protein